MAAQTPSPLQVLEVLQRQLRDQQQEIQSLRSDHETQQQELQSLRSGFQTEIQTLRSELLASRTRVQELSQLHQTPAPRQSSSRSHLPDPPRFDGKPLTLRTWLPSIKAKLRSDQLVGADAFDYVWDRLEQPQQASVLHLRQTSEDAQSWDPDTIFSFFQRLCHNPREQQEAVQRFSLVRQRDDESLVAFLARFERLSFEAKASSWPSVSRVSALHRGLRQSLRQHLEESHDSLFELSYDDYVELVQSFDRRLRRPQPQQPRRQPPSGGADAMDVDPFGLPLPAFLPSVPPPDLSLLRLLLPPAVVPPVVVPAPALQPPVTSPPAAAPPVTVPAPALQPPAASPG